MVLAILLGILAGLVGFVPLVLALRLTKRTVHGGTAASMIVLLLGLAVLGLFTYAENRCADEALLVIQRGVPSEDALSWMEASDYTITPLDRAPEGSPERAASRWRFSRTSTTSKRLRQTRS